MVGFGGHSRYSPGLKPIKAPNFETVTISRLFLVHWYPDVFFQLVFDPSGDDENLVIPSLSGRIIEDVVETISHTIQGDNNDDLHSNDNDTY